MVPDGGITDPVALGDQWFIFKRLGYRPGGEVPFADFVPHSFGRPVRMLHVSTRSPESGSFQLAHIPASANGRLSVR